MEERAIYNTGHKYKIILKTDKEIIAEIPFGKNREKALETLKAFSLIPFRTKNESILIFSLEREKNGKSEVIEHISF